MTDIEEIVERARGLLDIKRPRNADMIEVLEALVRCWDDWKEERMVCEFCGNKERAIRWCSGCRANVCTTCCETSLS